MKDKDLLQNTLSGDFKTPSINFKFPERREKLQTRHKARSTQMALDTHNHRINAQERCLQSSKRKYSTSYNLSPVKLSDSFQKFMDLKCISRGTSFETYRKTCATEEKMCSWPQNNVGLNWVGPQTLGLFPTVTIPLLDLRLGESADSEEAWTGRANFILYSNFQLRRGSTQALFKAQL